MSGTKIVYVAKIQTVPTFEGQRRRGELKRRRRAGLIYRMPASEVVCMFAECCPEGLVLRVLLIGSIAAEFGLRAPIKNDRVVS